MSLKTTNPVLNFLGNNEVLTIPGDSPELPGHARKEPGCSLAVRCELKIRPRWRAGDCCYLLRRMWEVSFPGAPGASRRRSFGHKTSPPPGGRQRPAGPAARSSRTRL